MLIIYPPNHARHASPHEIYNGEQDPHQETPDRLERITSALSQAAYQYQAVSEVAPLELLERTHDANYLNFIQQLSLSLKDSEYRYPSVFQYRTGVPSQHQLAQLGSFSFDMYTPVGVHTWQAALDSASCAYEAALAVQTGSQKVVYALGRPPGHHAEANQMGGYCYINNCAVAAEYLSGFGRVAALDVDFHHGNGTQHIFYHRPDVLTVSIHAHPDWKFPFFSGYENEVGSGEGEGFNRNFALTENTTDNQYQIILEQALDHIREFKPEYLVVSLGLDTHETDPIGGFKLTTSYFTQMAQTIADMQLPTVIIQEGGYNTDLLGKNVVAFLQGFEP